MWSSCQGDPRVEPGQDDIGQEVAQKQEGGRKQQKRPGQEHVLGRQGGEKDRAGGRQAQDDAGDHGEWCTDRCKTGASAHPVLEQRQVFGARCQGALDVTGGEKRGAPS